MTLVDADRVRFRCRMDGLSGDWVDAGTRREAFYPGLPHGSFLFRVAASIDGTTWREASVALLVTVRPFFYQTAWFLALALAGVLAAAGTAYKVRTVQLRRRQAEMERLVEEKTEELQERERAPLPSLVPRRPHRTREQAALRRGARQSSGGARSASEPPSPS